MKTKKTAYCITTAWVVCIVTISGFMSVLHVPRMMEGFAHLGNPPNFANLLGVAKPLGVCVAVANPENAR
jgi:hypothetical protein